MTGIDHLFPVASEAVARARRTILKQAPGLITDKGDRDLVTDVDLAIERNMREFLQAEAPGIGFLGEEEGRSGSHESEYMWALDPIDGTVNFIHGLPLCAVVLGLVRHNEAQFGIIDLPIFEIQYSTIRGGGAFRDGERIHVSGTCSMRDSVVALGDYAVGEGADIKNADRLAITSRLAACVGRIRMLGSAAIDLAWLAEGRIDACIMLANKQWETAAGVLLAREAGALVVDRFGAPHTPASTSTVALSPELRDELLPLLALQ